MRRVEMTEDEYKRYMKQKERARRDAQYSTLVARLRQQGHQNKGLNALMIEVFPPSVVDFIVAEWNPMPPAPPAVRNAVVPGAPDPVVTLNEL